MSGRFIVIIISIATSSGIDLSQTSSNKWLFKLLLEIFSYVVELSDISVIESNNDTFVCAPILTWCK